MSYKKDDNSNIFPTRTGDAQGASLERKMIDVVGGPDGIRRRLHINPDGKTTLLKTRGGNPEFLTINESVLCPVYSTISNSGFIDTSYNFMGVGDTSDEPIRSLIQRDGMAYPDKEVFIRNSHTWKEAFLYGEAFGAESNYSGLPSNFSGAMRRLMQVYHGTVSDRVVGQEEVPLGTTCPPPPIKQPFSCTYAKTHGVFFSPSGKRWIIEVSPNGVFRIEVSFLREFSSQAYVAEEIDEATALDYWTTVETKWGEKVLIGAAPTSYDLGYSPMYYWCGWAFNSIGSAATNVLLRAHPTRANWLQAAMFDLSISLSGDIPSYATCTMSDVQDLASPINDLRPGYQANIQSPIDVPGLCYTFSIYVSGASGVDAPIFSFYEGMIKRVYRFQVYSTRAASDGNFDTGGYPVVAGCSPTGDMTYPGGSNTFETQTEGTRSETRSGSSGGGTGVAGEGFQNQNVDINASVSDISYDTSISGYAITSYTTGLQGDLANGMSTDHNVEVTTVGISADGQTTTTSITIERYPPLSKPTTISYMQPIRARVTVNGSGRNRTITHLSTLIINGYDRESISCAVTTNTSEGAYTRSGNWDADYRMSLITGPILYGGPGFPAPMYPMEVGSVDATIPSSTTQARDGPGYILIESHYSPITGAFDCSSLIGTVGQCYGTIRNSDGTGIGTPTVYESVPAKNITTKTLYTRVGGITKENTFSFNLHRADPGQASFSLYVGAAAFSFAGLAYFYSADGNEKPTIVGLGARTQAQAQLYGFIGAF